MIKLITLNVEQHLHLDKIFPFLEQEDAEVVCLQEIDNQDAQEIARRFKYHYVFLPMLFRQFTPDSPLRESGIALLSKYPLSDIKSAYYHQPHEKMQIYVGTNKETKRQTIAECLIWAKIEKDGKKYTVGTTHFTWTPNGQSDEYQKTDVKKLLEITDQIPDLILCGDFNVPRNYNDVYPLLVEKFKDNIPLSFHTTMDAALHKTKNNPVESERISKFVVDYIFTTPKYQVSDVRQKFGVSDHAAIIANISQLD